MIVDSRHRQDLLTLDTLLQYPSRNYENDPILTLLFVLIIHALVANGSLVMS